MKSTFEKLKNDVLRKSIQWVNLEPEDESNKKTERNMVESIAQLENFLDLYPNYREEINAQ